MKVAIITSEHPYSGNRGGIGRYLRDYIPELAKHADVSMISIEKGIEIDNVKSYYLNKPPLPSPLLPPLYSLKINKILKEINPDVVEYANWMGLGCMDNGDWEKFIRISTPVLFGSLRKGLFPKLALPIHHYWEKKCMENMDYCISNSYANIETCTKAYKKLPNTSVIPHGINLPITYPKENANDILFVGRFEERKGLDILLKAWKLLLSENQINKNIKLRIVGRETYPCPEGYLKQLLTEIKIPSNRIIIHNNPDDEELDNIKKECIVNVIPSRYESFGMVALEAHASNLAVVATEIGGLQEVIKNNENGLLFQNENFKELAKQIKFLLINCEERNKFIKTGIKFLNTKFSIQNMVKESIKIYEKNIK